VLNGDGEERIVHRLRKSLRKGNFQFGIFHVHLNWYAISEKFWCSGERPWWLKPVAPGRLERPHTRLPFIFRCQTLRMAFCGLQDAVHFASGKALRFIGI
jgi:hypothetical protein